MSRSWPASVDASAPGTEWPERPASVQPRNGLGKEGRDRHDLQRGVYIGRDRYCVGHDESLYRKGSQHIAGTARKDAVGHRDHSWCAAAGALERMDCFADGAAGGDHVVDDDGHVALDVPGDPRRCDFDAGRARLMDHGKGGTDGSGDTVREPGSTQVGCHDHGPADVPDPLNEEGDGLKVLDRYREEAFHSRLMQVHDNDLVDVAAAQDVGYHSGAQSGPLSTSAPILAAVAEEGDNCGHPGCSRARGGIGEQEKFDDVAFGWGRHWLDDEHVGPAQGHLDAHNLGIGVVGKLRRGDFSAQHPADIGSQARMSPAGKDFEHVILLPERGRGGGGRFRR